MIKEASDFGVKIEKANLSRFMKMARDNAKGQENNGLSQKQILWLCVRYGVQVKLHIARIDYNESMCLTNLKKLLGSVRK